MIVTCHPTGECFAECQGGVKGLLSAFNLDWTAVATLFGCLELAKTGLSFLIRPACNYVHGQYAGFNSTNIAMNVWVDRSK